MKEEKNLKRNYKINKGCPSSHHIGETREFLRLQIKEDVNRGTSKRPWCGDYFPVVMPRWGLKREECMTPETAVKQEIRNWLNIKGWFNFHILQGIGSYKGIADIIAIKNGITLYIEAKSATGKLTSNEAQFFHDIDEHGGHYIIARGYEDIENYLKMNELDGYI